LYVPKLPLVYVPKLPLPPNRILRRKKRK
jgi:hypothetical protein